MSTDCGSPKDFSYGTETVRPAFPDRDLPLISYGLHYPEALKQQIEKLQCKRVYLLISRSLADTTNVLSLVQAQLGQCLVGHRIGMKPHTLWSELWEILQEARPLDIDLIATVGAGSLTDAAKVVSWALANEIHSVRDFTMLTLESGSGINLQAPAVKQISIPTTLSGGEYSSFAGATDDQSKTKYMFAPSVQNPITVILDPEVTLTTPMRVWLSTGVRAVDHCIEGLCSLQCTPEAEVILGAALTTLLPALLKCKAEQNNVEARFQSQLGSIEAMRGVSLGVALGGSHAIGHQLGPFGVGHGETSCVCLPAVCRFNASRGANNDRQHVTLAKLLGLTSVRNLVGNRTDLELGDVLALIIEQLGMPRSLRGVGIDEKDLEGIARNVITDRWAATNPVPLTDTNIVLELLSTML